jgi:hypothetical protein
VNPPPPVPYGFPVWPLPWRDCDRDTPGALWNGARWVAPPNGPCRVIVAACGVVRRDLDARPRPAWLPYWKRPRPADAPRPDEHGPRVIFRGTPDGVEVGGIDS